MGIASDLLTAFKLGPTLHTLMTIWTQAKATMLHKPTQQGSYKKYIRQPSVDASISDAITYLMPT